jgi:K+-transporting ATPase ATPase C chain
MIRETWNALAACLVTLVLCAGIYPAAVWGLGQLAFPKQAEGSLIERDGKVIGSELIAQPFASDKYFQPRPSAADYKADAASGSNLSTTNPDQRKKVAERAEALKATASNPAPVDLVMASGGGLDPHISPEAARYQAARVAKARGLSLDRVQALVDAHTERSGAILGAPPRVNVLLLNLALDQEKPGPATAASHDEAKPDVAQPAAKAEATGTPASAADASPKQEAARPDGSGPDRTDGLSALSGRLDRLEERVGATSTERLAAEVKDLQARVAKFAEAPGDPAQTTKRLTELDGHVSAVGREVRSVRSDVKGLQEAAKAGEGTSSLEAQVKALRAEVESLREAAKKAAATGGDPKGPTSGPDLEPIARMLREKQFAAAAGASKTLARAFPDDARVWYFAALANGLTTKDWRGETEDLVSKGVARERAGTPPAAEIDSAFAGLTRENGRDWLGYYRRRVAGP